MSGRKRRSNESVELNVTAMLDMAFQLLTFFILTFRPPPVEGEIFMRMPPPLAVVGAASGASTGVKDDPSQPKAVKTLTITLLDTDNSGNVGKVEVGIPSVGMSEIPFNDLSDKLGEYFKAPGGAFEQVVLQASPSLHWSEVMRAFDVCARQKLADGKKLEKLSFMTLGDK